MKAEDISRVAVIGAGMMGHGIAQIFAARNYRVRLLDVKKELLDKAKQNVRANLSLMASKGIFAEGEIEGVIGRIETTTEMAEAAEAAQLVIEAVSENLELKQRIFQELERLGPEEAILATNTSVISITEIAAKCQRRGRIVGTHFWNPPYLIPLVEVVKGQDSSEEALETTYQLLKKVGKHPVKVMKDVPGFVGNRLQHALWREAISIVAHGIADAATVDDVIKQGFGIRLPVLGPLENVDMVGLELVLTIHDYVLKYLEASPGPSPLLREKVAEGELGFKSGRGFYSWTPEEAQRSKERLTEYLLERLRENQAK